MSLFCASHFPRIKKDITALGSQARALGRSFRSWLGSNAFVRPHKAPPFPNPYTPHSSESFAGSPQTEKRAAISTRPAPDMSSRAHSPWLKKVKRIIGRRLRSGSLSAEDARQLCDEALSSIRVQPPPPTASMARGTDYSSCQDLGRFIGKCYRSGNLAPEDALDLFDELLQRAKPGSVIALTQLLTVVARASASSSVSDGPAVAVSLFNCMARAGTNRVTPDLHTYSVIIGCYCQMGRLDLGFATFGRILKTGGMVNAVVFTHLLEALCAVKRTSDAMDIVLRRMPELACTPNVFSFSILLKGFCDENKSQEALELLRMMAHNGDSCTPNVVSFTTVIDGLCKEGQVDNAYNLFREMLDHGIGPNVVTCNSIIDGLCKAHAIGKAEATLQQMLDKGVTPDCFTYSSLIHGYFSLGKWNEAIRILKEMCKVGQKPDVVTYNTLIDYLCKNGKCAEAREIFDSMVEKGEKPNVATYGILLYGYAIQGNFIEMNHLIDLMVQNEIPPNHHVFSILINACGKHGMVDEAMLIFNEMRRLGLMPDTVSYGSVIEALCRAGRLDDAMFQFNQLINEGQSPNIYVFTTLIHGFSAWGNWEKAEVLFYEMLDRGIRPDARVFDALIHNLLKEGRVMEARNMSDLMACAGLNSWNVFAEILQKANVVTTPVSRFGPSSEGFVRVSAFGHRDHIVEAVRRLKQLYK